MGRAAGGMTNDRLYSPVGIQPLVEAPTQMGSTFEIRRDPAGRRMGPVLPFSDDSGGIPDRNSPEPVVYRAIRL